MKKIKHDFPNKNKLISLGEYKIFLLIFAFVIYVFFLTRHWDYISSKYLNFFIVKNLLIYIFFSEIDLLLVFLTDIYKYIYIFN